jgi:hypothetical protein
MPHKSFASMLAALVLQVLVGSVVMQEPAQDAGVMAVA